MGFLLPTLNRRIMDMKLWLKLALAGLLVAFFSSSAYAQSGTLPPNCITFKDVKFTYLPKGNYKYGMQKIWVQINNNCGQDVSDLLLKGYLTTASAPQDWKYNFAYAFVPVKAGGVGTGVAQFEAKEATFLRVTIEKGSTVLAEKIFEPKDFDKMRGIVDDKSKSLPAQPAKPKTVPGVKQ